MNIYDKIFTYIDSKSALNTLGADLIEQYKNSLIFIGDQKQIYQPLTNTYIGIGQDEFDRLEAAINQSGNNLTAFNTYMHDDVVTHIYAQYSADDLLRMYNESQNDGINRILIDNNPDNNNIVISGSNYKNLTSTNRNVLIKGLYDYNPNTPYSNTYFDVNVSNAGNYNYEYSKDDYSYGTSGINVSVKHTGVWRTSGPTSEYPYGFSYWDGQDILTIDDKLTWAYIGHNTSYLKNYARTIAAEEANRIYHNLLGEDVVYISKNLSNILYYDSSSSTPNFNNLYVRVVDTTETVGYKHLQTTVVEDNDNPGTYLVKLGDVVLGSYDVATGVFYISTTVETDLGTTKLTENDGWTRDGSNVVNDIIWYTEDPATISPYNYNLVDGINTIKEVAYILDTITDGSDAGISIAYNIKQNHTDIINLQEWQTTVTNPATSSFVTSFDSSANQSNFIILNSYSTSQSDETKGDIKLYGDLILAHTYTLNGVAYAAYTTGQIEGDKYYRYIDYFNYDDSNNYVCVNDTSNGGTTTRINAAKKLAAAGYPNNASFVLYKLTSTGYERGIVSTTATLSQLINSATSNIVVDGSPAFVFIPFKEHEISAHNGVLNGITTVEWVTTYIGHGLNDLTNKLNEGNTGAQNYTDEKIGELDASYTAPAGKFISGITQTDGLINNVNYTDIPKDIIYTDPIIANEDDFIKIPYNLARIYNTDVNQLRDIYYVDTTTHAFTNIGGNTLDESTQYYIKTALPANRFKLATGLDFNPTELTDLIGSGYNFFKQVISADKTIYVPVDLQEEIKLIRDDDTSGTPDLTLVTTPLYYIDFTQGTRFSEYINGSTSLGPDGHTNINLSVNISYLSTSNENNTGLADAYDVRRTIERMFTWVDLSTNADFVRATA